MGIVFKYAQQNKLIADYIDRTIDIFSSIVVPGKTTVQIGVAPVTSDEVSCLVNMLDRMTLCPTWDTTNDMILQKDDSLVDPGAKEVLKSLYAYSEIARVVAEELTNILILMRAVEYATQGMFLGDNSFGPDLTIRWLNERYIKSPFNSGDTSLIPSQTMSPCAGVIHLGLLINDWTNVLRDDQLKFTLNDIPLTPYDINRPLTFFPRPIMVLPNTKQKIEFTQGDKTKPSPLVKLISLVVCQAQDVR